MTNNEYRNILNTLTYVRHDWLNQIQLIKGYLTLGKTKDAERIIDEIVFCSQQESKLTQLGLPKFAVLILTYNWQDSSSISLKFAVNIIHKVKNLGDEDLYLWMNDFLSLLHNSINPLHENNLHITIESYEDRLVFLLKFNGMLENLSTLKSWILQFDGNIELLTETEFTMKLIYNG